MIGEFTRAVLEGYTAPRHAVRRILDGGLGVEHALGMLAMGYLVQAILTVLFISSGIGIAGHFVAILQQLVMFFLLSALIHGVGRMAGGTGTLQGAQLVVGWHALVTSFISPLAIGVSAAALGAEGAEGVPGSVAVLAFVYVGISFWLMANYIAELHDFRSTGAVLGSIIGLTFAFAILVASIFGALAPA